VDAFRVSAEWTPSDDLFFRIAGDFVDDDSNAKHGHREAPGEGLAAGDPVFKDPYDTYGGIGSDNSVETMGVSLLAQWRLNDVYTFKSITAYREGETDTVIDFDMGPSPALDVPGLYEDDQFTQEFQLLFTGERLQGVVGLFYLDATASGGLDSLPHNGYVVTTIRGVCRETHRSAYWPMFCLTAVVPLLGVLLALLLFSL
jgi:iron complex outermembrane receptor protein